MVETEPSKDNFLWLMQFLAKQPQPAGRFDDADLWGDAAEDVSFLFILNVSSP